MTSTQRLRGRRTAGVVELPMMLSVAAGRRADEGRSVAKKESSRLVWQHHRAVKTMAIAGRHLRRVREILRGDPGVQPCTVTQQRPDRSLERPASSRTPQATGSNRFSARLEAQRGANAATQIATGIGGVFRRAAARFQPRLVREEDGRQGRCAGCSRARKEVADTASKASVPQLPDPRGEAGDRYWRA